MMKIRWILWTIVASLALAGSAIGQDVPGLGPNEAFERLKAPGAVLVDVRSVAEYVLVGHPTTAHNVPSTFWSESQAGFEPNPGFIDDLKARFKASDILIFICRSGGRSRRAAEAAREAGFPNVFNVLEGFEGEKDEEGRRTVGGWKNRGLPWTYDVDPKLAYAFR